MGRWFDQGHIWPYMGIYGHIWAIYGPYMGHIWPYMGRSVHALVVCSLPLLAGASALQCSCVDTSYPILDHHSRMIWIFLYFFGPIFGSRWPLFGPPWPSPGLPGLRFNSLDLRESSLDPAETKFRPKYFRDFFFGGGAFYVLNWPRMASKPS